MCYDFVFVLVSPYLFLVFVVYCEFITFLEILVSYTLKEVLHGL